MLTQRGHDRLAIDPEGFLLVVVLQVTRELVDADLLQLLELGDVIISCAQHAEAVHDLVRYESSVDVPCAAMLVVVVALPTFDVVGQRLRDPTGVAVLRHNVGYMVADHAAEPAALVSLVHPVVTDVPGAESQRPFTTDEVAALLNVPLDTIHEWHERHRASGLSGAQGEPLSKKRR